MGTETDLFTGMDPLDYGTSELPQWLGHQRKLLRKRRYRTEEPFRSFALHEFLREVPPFGPSLAGTKNVSVNVRIHILAAGALDPHRNSIPRPRDEAQWTG